MNKYIPQLIIKYAYPLDQERRNLYLSKNFGPYPDAKKVISITNHIEELWSELNIDNFVADTKRTPRLKNYWDYAKKEYGKEEPSTLHHIIVFAVLIEIYTKLFGEENIGKYIIPDNLPKPYLRAWEIVKENGHENIIQKFRSLTKIQ